MVPTYALVRQTLVLDYELQHFTPTTTDSLQAATEEEFLARLVVSGWRSRCWTHQESQVSRRILVQCRGSTAAFDHSLFRPLPRSDVRDELHGQVLAWHNYDYRKAGWRAMLSLQALFVIPDLKKVWFSFHGKTASRLDDVLAVFASIMGLSVAQIMPLENRMRAILHAAIAQEGRLPAGIFFSPALRMPSTGRLDDFDRWIPCFPGEGGDIDYGAGFAIATRTGFYLPIDQYSKGRRGCFGLKVPRPDQPIFHVRFNCKLLEVSLCFPEQLPQLPENVTHLVLALAMPQSGTTFEGVGACLIQYGDDPSWPVSWIIGSFDTVWYCSLRFRQMDDQTAYRLDATQIEAVTLPQELKSRAVIIRSGRYTKWCEIEDLLTTP